MIKQIDNSVFQMQTVPQQKRSRVIKMMMMMKKRMMLQSSLPLKLMSLILQCHQGRVFLDIFFLDFNDCSF